MRGVQLLKVAQAANAGGELLGRGARASINAAKKVLSGAGDFGQGVAAGAGLQDAGQAAGRLAGQAAVVGGTIAGAKHVKQKIDDTVEDARVRREIRRQQRLYGG
jgi:hypothetical protein